MFLPVDLYVDSPADSPELAGGITVTPKDEAAQKAEDAEMLADITAIKDFAPPVREL